MTRWISLYWLWLLPMLAMLGTLFQLRQLQGARRRELLTPHGWRWMLTGLIAAQCLIWFAQAALVYQTNFWLPGAALAAVALMLVALRAARRHIHPGLHGFQRPVPQDGLELLTRGDNVRWRRLTRLGSLLPAWGLLLYLTWYHPERWWELSLLALICLAPLLLIPFRQYWLSPLLLALPVLILMRRAWLLYPTLPAGVWTAPLTGASCKGQLHASPPRGWCVNVFTGTVYQFDLRTGVVTLQTHLSESARVFAANANWGWIQQTPARGLVRVEAAEAASTPLRVLSAHRGAADSENRLWVIDVGDQLSVFAGAEAKPLRADDGLLNNTALCVKVSPGGDVWVGSIEGVSWLPAGATKWRTLNLRAHLPGAVRNLAFRPGASGTVWLLWQVPGGRSWGVSALAADGGLRHSFDLGAHTGLEFPLTEHPLAVDGLGRVWFVSQSIVRREKYVGLFNPEGNSVLALHSLGNFSTRGPYAYGQGLWRDSFGVVADGAGGIILFNGDADPWRRWHP